MLIELLQLIEPPLVAWAAEIVQSVSDVFVRRTLLLEEVTLYTILGDESAWKCRVRARDKKKGRERERETVRKHI